MQISFCDYAFCGETEYIHFLIRVFLSDAILFLDNEDKYSLCDLQEHILTIYFNLVFLFYYRMFICVT